MKFKGFSLEVAVFEDSMSYVCDICLKAFISYDFTMYRYIEIFKSSLQEIRVAVGMSGPKMRPLIPNRPGPYDRSDRFGGMMNRYAMGRGRNFRGNSGLLYFKKRLCVIMR